MSEPDDKRSFLDRHSGAALSLALGAILVALVGAGALIATNRKAGRADSEAPPHNMLPSHVRTHTRKGELEVLVGELWFKPSATRLHAGTYRLIARSYGGTAHDTMLERAPIKMEAPGQPMDSAAPFGIDDLQPGMTKSTTVTLTRGRWELFCSFASHYQGGQHRYITVYGNLPRGKPRAPKMGGMSPS